MNIKIKSLLASLVVAAVAVLGIVSSHATYNKARWFRFVMNSRPGLHVNIDGHPADPLHSDSLVSGDRIDATWPSGGCNPGPGGGSVGYVFVNDSAGNPVYHTDPTTGQSQNWYELTIGQGCESGSWTVNTSANPPYNPGQQYCPCQGGQQ